VGQACSACISNTVKASLRAWAKACYPGASDPVLGVAIQIMTQQEQNILLQMSSGQC
jgi:hypothetical protein